MKKAVGAGVATFLGVLILPMLFLVVVLTPSTSKADECDDSKDQDGTPPAVEGSADNGTYKPSEHSSDPLAEATASFMEKIAIDDSHGYSQPRRGGNPDYDCSSAVFFAVKAAGAPVKGGPFTTYTMGPALTAAGFRHMTWSGDWRNSRTELRRGDIVVNPVAHTEVYVGGGLFAAARHAYPSGIDDGHPGDQGRGSSQEIIISPYLDAGLTQLYRHDPNAKANAPLDPQMPGAPIPVSCESDADGAPSPPAGSGSVEQARKMAKTMIPNYFPGTDTEAEYKCLVDLWQGESGWRVDATNPSSGAYGIPQALPGSKMASAGRDWRTNAATQIKWGLGYIKGRSEYGTPCKAWHKWQSRSPHWY